MQGDLFWGQGLYLQALVTLRDRLGNLMKRIVSSLKTGIINNSTRSGPASYPSAGWSLMTYPRHRVHQSFSALTRCLSPVENCLSSLDFCLFRFQFSIAQLELFARLLSPESLDQTKAEAPKRFSMASSNSMEEKGLARVWVTPSLLTGRLDFSNC